MICRYSSRKTKLDQSFLNEKLKQAKTYDRIAGYFSASILEVAGEAIEEMEGCVRVVCNSAIAIDDIQSATAACNEMRREWCRFHPERFSCNGSGSRLRRLWHLLRSQKLRVRVIPNEIFGLIHGKAGVITLKDNTRLAFIGSVNETYSGWRLNYEILWEDDTEEAVQWVQDEFDFFWNSPYAIPLSEFIIKDIRRISQRTMIRTVEAWRNDPNPAATVIESPVYRQEFGLWEHQKYFVQLAFHAHQHMGGARFVLADTVGLGKTIQLALTAQLMGLYGEKPILIIAPKTLVWQWQEEMHALLDMPSAVWNGKGWQDENGFCHPCTGEAAVRKCPRRTGIISQGLIIGNSDMAQHFLNMTYECVIVDEAHRARRRNLGPGKENQRPAPNNLMRFLTALSKQTRSMLLATATPVQMYPVEAWDLLYILSQNTHSVLGNPFSMWRKFPEYALKLITGKARLGHDSFEYWDWIRNPFPPASENQRTFGRIRMKLNMAADDFVIRPEAYDMLNGPDKSRLKRIITDNFMQYHNPFIRHIVRRTREHLETAIHPETREPYLKQVNIRLSGESDEEAIPLPPYLHEAYTCAEEFAGLLQKRLKGRGFIQTLLLRRTGSTMIAGKITAERMLHNWNDIREESYCESSESEYDTEASDAFPEPDDAPSLNEAEQNCLRRFIQTLEANKERDPKYQKVYELLIHQKWAQRGCILFSQFFDSAYWIAETLSKEIKDQCIGIYAGGNKSGLMGNGIYENISRETLKQMVKQRELKIIVGTDAASEGLNLQTLGTLINLDLPWNPTRLEQRKGRIQRIGQLYDEVWIHNMRYKDSVEDRVHSLLSARFENIHHMFGQIPDVLEDVWVDVALKEIAQAKQKIDAIPQQHPFVLRYQENVGHTDWESCTTVLDKGAKKKYLMKGWGKG